MTDSKKRGTLYLIPNTLGTESLHDIIPPGVREKISLLKHFIVENEKAARHFLKAAGIKTPQQELVLKVIEKHETNTPVRPLMQPLFEGFDTGLLSDAGSPAVADPGAAFVQFAHENNIRVVPLTGPSSILLALAASGLNGQQFCFHGYLPVTKAEKISRLKQLEKESGIKKQTQIFIETPYRNNAMLADILEACHHETRLCIAVDLTLPGEMIKTMTVAAWKKTKTDLHKRPAVFLILQR